MALVAAVRQGDLAAFETLVSCHERRIYGLARRITGSVEDAQDVTQQTFISAMRNLSRFRETAAFSTWLTTIAEHADHGGGNAPEGECGALYAACQVAARRGGNPENLRRRFAAVHGHTACRELRARRVACAACVRSSADLVKG